MFATKDPFIVREIHKLNKIEFAFSNFKELAILLKDALLNGALKREKRYYITIKEL